MKFIDHTKLKAEFKALYLINNNALRYLGHVNTTLKQDVIRYLDNYVFITNDCKIIKQGQIRILESIGDVVSEMNVFESECPACTIW